MDVIVVETPELGDRSYVVCHDHSAVVVDPQRDIDRILAIVNAHDLTISHVLETHLHNDYVTGGLELAQRTGAVYVVGGGAEASYSCVDARDGSQLQSGEMGIEVRRSPGHTVNHVAYLVSVDGETPAIFTGGSMLYGTVGRTDLVGPIHTHELTVAQYHSVRRLASETNESAAVWPTHGFGSFCSSAASSGASASTIAAERGSNIACVTNNEEVFVRELLDGLTAYPSYYAHMGLLNRAGLASPFQLSLPPVIDASEVGERVRSGAWVIDLRPRRSFAQRHLAGSVGVEHGNSFTTYLGWIIPWGMPLTVLGESEAQILAAQRDLARIGIDRFAAMAIVDSSLLDALDTRSYPVSNFADLAETWSDSRRLTVLDVRRDDEWDDGHLDGAVHIPLSDLTARRDEVPDGEVWVHCAAGYRASIGASLVDFGDRKVTLIDNDWASARLTGLPVS